MTPVLQLKGVDKSYRRGDVDVQVLADFDFTLAAGEFVVVTGPFGAGKSTLLHIAGGLDVPDSGTVAVAGQDMWAMSMSARAAFRRAQPRPCVPVLQLGVDADRGRERVVAAGARRRGESFSGRTRRGASALGRAR
jgi:ABC-type taurine transport system ATPase subunit